MRPEGVLRLGSMQPPLSSAYALAVLVVKFLAY